MMKCIPLLLASLFILGCDQAEMQKAPVFKSDKYGFSFEYPKEWKEVKEGLPDRWAIVSDKKDTIILVVEPAVSDDLLVLGRNMAFKDIYGENADPESVKKEDLVDIFKIVKTDSFSNRTWYNYGMRFQDKGIDSFISGTICSGNEITIVLVNSGAYEAQNQEIYRSLLETFSC